MQLDGSGRQRLTQRGGTHDATFNDSLTRFVDNWSDVATPPQISSSNADGKVVKLIFDMNEGRELDQFDLVEAGARARADARRLRHGSGDLPAAELRPGEEVSGLRAHVQRPARAAGEERVGRHDLALFHQMLAQNGVVVWICDNRTASGKGRDLGLAGLQEPRRAGMRDLEDGLAGSLRSQASIGRGSLLNGWSYGGFMTTYALTHSTKWSAGIAGGSVTDWHDYDSVYTERYMLTPEHNKEGYERSSPAQAAANLQAKLLLLHGAIDDNVHVQNTIQFIYALQKAGKQFEMMLYPKSRHGVTDPDLVKQMRYLMLDFVMRNLKP